MDEQMRKRSMLWIRLGSVTVAAGALFYVFRRVEPSELRHTLRNCHFDWLLVAIAVYGTAFLPAAWRWHLMLRLTGGVVHFTATFILSLIGHFFYTVFFGVAGGDLAKSALYANWFRFSLPEILAAAPLDRLLGFGGLVLFIILSFGVAIFNGAFVHLELGSSHFPAAWLIAAVTLVLIGFLGFRRSGQSSGASRWLQAFAMGGRQVLKSWPIFSQGLLCGFLVQVALAGSLALGLQAISHSPLPWGRLAWTFPVITIISAVPFTVAGLGFREGAALTLLGLYGISSADAVAASLLTLIVRLFWAFVGGLLFWRERRLQSSQRPLPKTISVVIPTLNESPSLGETIQRLREIPEISEVIIVDGGSRDETRTIAVQLGCRVLTSPPGRGGQMRLGAAQSTGDVILLLHADTWLPAHAGKALINCLRDNYVAGGGFWKRFRDASPLLLGSRFKCAIRLYCGRRVLGDQAMFIRREVLEAIGGVPDMPLMEEFELCRRLRAAGRLALADATVTTSARRFAKLGVLRTYLRMWRVTWQYRLGTAPKDLRRIYEKD
jgi:rSAM/selenodomain-associated transferase 2